MNDNTVNQEYINSDERSEIPVSTYDLNSNERSDIISITPKHTDPVVYWHSVAVDAIKDADKLRSELSTVKNELDSIRKDYHLLVDKLVEHNHSGQDVSTDSVKTFASIIAAITNAGVDSYMSINFSKHDNGGV